MAACLILGPPVADAATLTITYHAAQGGAAIVVEGEYDFGSDTGVTAAHIDHLAKRRSDNASFGNGFAVSVPPAGFADSLTVANGVYDAWCLLTITSGGGNYEVESDKTEISVY